MDGQVNWPGTEVTPQQPAQAGAPALRQIVAPTPNLPTPQAPALEAHTNVETTRTQQQIDQGETGGHNATAEMQLHQQYRQDPRIQNYEAILPVYNAAQHAADTPAGDLNIVTAFAKMMDPSTGVREGEAASVADAASPGQRLSGYMNYLSGGGRLPPEVRQQLLAELASRGTAINNLYNAARGDYQAQATRYGFDPRAITGQHAAIPFRRQMGLADHHEQDVGDAGVEIHFRGDPRRPANDYPTVAPGGRAFQAAISNAVNSGRYHSGQELIDYARTIDPALAERLDAPSVNAAVAWRAAHPHGAPIAVQLGMDPPAHPSLEQEGLGHPDSAAESGAAAVRGATSSFSAGLDHPLSAAYRSATGDGSFEENLWRENNIDEYNYQHHFPATVGGSLVGAAALPTGVVNEARTAAEGIIAAGGTRAQAMTAARTAATRRLAMEGAIYGGVHGTATGEGDLPDRIANGVLETIEGAAGGAAVGRLGPSAVRLSRERPPLVDPVTERLNEPLESATPAERVGAAQEHGIDLPLGSATDRGGAILEKGLDILPASAGTMNDARRTAAGQVNTAVENLANRYGSARTLADMGTALRTGAQNWITRFHDTARKAYEAIPIPPEARATLDNTVTALRGMTSRFASNPDMAETMRNPRLAAYQRALENGGLTWQETKDFRTIIGDEIGEARFSDSPARSDLRGLYGALSQDMRATAEAQGPSALRSFERANTLYRQGEERIDNALVQILGDDSKNNPERAAAALTRLTQSGKTGNLGQLAQVRASMMKGGEWDDVAGALIRLSGQPRDSTGRAFNPQTFVQNYADMSEAARNLLFSGGRRQELRQALDGFVGVMQRMAGTNALRNTSQSATGLTAAGTIGTIISGLANPILGAKIVAAGSTNYAMGRLWTNPAFVRWATGYTRMAAGAARAGGAPSAKAVSGQRAHLMRIARSSPAIADAIADVDHRIFGEDQSNPQ